MSERIPRRGPADRLHWIPHGSEVAATDAATERDALRAEVAALRAKYEPPLPEGWVWEFDQYVQTGPDATCMVWRMPPGDRYEWVAGEHEGSAPTLAEAIAAAEKARGE